MVKNDIDELVLKKFDMKSLLPNATILLLGRRRTGKSFLTRDIFYNHRDIPQGVIFSGTEEANPFYGDFIPDTFIYPKYDADTVEAILSKQGKKNKKSKGRTER